SGKYQLHELLERPVNIQSPELIIVDLKEELKQYPVKEHIMLSSRLSTAIEKCLTFNEQVILFQNKRGYSSYLHCIDCGQISDCPNCSISLVYHKADNQLICHFCGHKEAISNKCPSCKSENLKLSGFGTQKIEELLRQHFPHARVMRMDSDTTRKKDGHRLILQQFESGEVDILIGTQMISKGLDFPNVTLVGVLNADLSLSIPDFRAAERSFQLISQVAGRAGRGEKAGHVIIQTFQPDHYAVQAAVANNFKQFYAIESHLRQDIFYPPFSRLINIRISSENEGQVFESISEFSNQLNRLIGDSIDLLGPVPCPIERINRKYRWQLLLKIKSSVDSPQFELKQKLMHVKEFLLKKFNSIHVAIDVDPYDLI
ncbi:MAG: primosomal protein N', partial [Calditrichaeota bacterium]|nr:primosomal protein N' [Calditrichota bacterium]